MCNLGDSFPLALVLERSIIALPVYMRPDEINIEIWPVGPRYRARRAGGPHVTGQVFYNLWFPS